MTEAEAVKGSETLVDLDLGDDGILVQRHVDGMVTIDQSSSRLVLTEQDFRVYVGSLVTVGKQEGWL